MRRMRLGFLTVALCLGGALTACGSGSDGEGYAAVGAGGASSRGATPPAGSVRLVPLDSPSASGTTSSTSSPKPGETGGAGASTSTTPGTGSTAGTAPGAGGSGGSSGSGSGGSGSGPGDATTVPGNTAPAPAPGGTAPAPGTPGTPSPTKPPATQPGPARLTISATLADADRRWCEQVTVIFRNTGGTAVASGTVAFETHVIGALGVDWATLGSTQPLPAPLAAGATKKQTYTVCVDSWRVPLGMHIDTQKVTATVTK